MKTSLLTKLLAAAVILGGTASLGMAQDTNARTCPFGNQPGYGRSVKFKQKKAQRATSPRRNFGVCPRQGQGQGWRNGYCLRNGRGRRSGICPWQNR